MTVRKNATSGRSCSTFTNHSTNAMTVTLVCAQRALSDGLPLLLLRSHVGVPVAAGHDTNSACDLVVGLIGKVRQRHPERPVGRLEPAAIEQHDAVILR